MPATAESRRSVPDFALESAALDTGARLVAGVDEAGRGPLAGPVVAAAVILTPGSIPDGLNDSKALSAGRRTQLFGELSRLARIGVGIADVARIDRDNILRATMGAMADAIEALGITPCMVLIDGNRVPDTASPCQAVIGGDRRSLSIAAASIVAKVTRDRIMEDLAAAHPGYGWDRNKGYGTAEHIAALARHGVTPHHRRSFRPVAETLTRR